MKYLKHFAASLAVCGLSSVAMAQESDSIFKSLDKNEDGLLVADEISESQQRFFERLLRAGDKNEDGKLSKAEYQATLKEDERPANTPDGRRPGPRGPGGGQFDQGAIFDRLDSNKDGKLSKDELPEQARDRMGRLFEQIGKDEITKEEYAKAMSQMMRSGRPGGNPGPGQGRPGGSDFFKQLDKNNDGKLSKDEVPERMAGLFERIGKDEISLDELAKMRQRREGDQAAGERPEGRPEMRRRGDGERRPDRPEGDRPRPEGDRPRPDMREGNRDGRPEGRRPGMNGPGGPGNAPAFMRVLDENQDGRISQGEALRIGKLFDELDKNKDGHLDGPELMGSPAMGSGDRERMARRPEGDRPEGARPENRQRGFGPEAFMARFDKNKDGAISKEEAPGRLGENFDQLDKNEDGKLTTEEFAGMFNRGGRPDGERGSRPPQRERREGDRNRENSDRPKRPEAE